MDIAKLTADELLAARPDLHASIVKIGETSAIDQLAKTSQEAAAAAVQEAMKAERVRVAAILDEAVKFQLPQLAGAMVTDGISAEQALLRLKDAKIEALTKAAPASPGPNSDQDALASDGADPETKWKADWAKDAKLRAEFSNSEGAYLAFQRAHASGKAKIFSIKQ